MSTTQGLKQQADQAALRARAIIVWVIGVLLAILAAVCIGAVVAAEML